MKLIASYTIPALAGLGLFALAAVLGQYTAIVFAAGIVTILIAGVVHDYSPRRPRWEPSHRGFVRFPGNAAKAPLAAEKIAA